MDNERVNFIYKLLIVLTGVYLLSNNPQAVFDVIDAIYNKEINKEPKERYRDREGNELPTMKTPPPT